MPTRSENDSYIKDALDNLSSIVRDIATNQAKSDLRFEQIAISVEELRKHVVVGNGTPGLLTKIPLMESRVDSLEEDVKVLKDDEKEDAKLAAVTKFQVHSMWVGLGTVAAGIVGVLIKTW